MSNSRNTSPHQYSPSYRYPDRIIDLELFMDAIFRREDAGAAIMTLNGDPLLFSEFFFLDFFISTNPTTRTRPGTRTTSRALSNTTTISSRLIYSTIQMGYTLNTTISTIFKKLFPIPI